MPRSTRDSDEEAKAESVIPARRTRAFAGATDSPLRRSTRIKQPAGQDESSPESPLSDNTSTGSNVQQRVTRRRSAVMEMATEKQRILRSRKNSLSSDISEINEEVSTPTRKTRRSVAATGSTDTPKTRTSTRLTRAGSETKSPTSMLKVTHKTRASSMGPETTIKENTKEKTVQPIKQRRRASVLPSEATLIEENEEHQKILVVQLDRTLSPLIESKETGKKNTLTDLITSRVSLSNDKVDTSQNNITDGRSEGLTHGQKAENLFTGSLEESDKSISNKENQATNIINESLLERSADSVVINASLQSPKPSSPHISTADKVAEDKNKLSITESPSAKPTAKISTKDDASSINEVEVNNTSQVMNSSMDITTNTDPSSCNMSTEESEISLKLVNPNVTLSVGKPARSDDLKDESTLNAEDRMDDEKHDINKTSTEKLESDKSSLRVVETLNEPPIKDATEKSEDSTVAEIDKILEEDSSIEDKEKAEGQLITEQKYDVKEDSQKSETLEEAKENDACDSTDTMQFSNLSGLTALETSDLLPVDSNESIKKTVSHADKKEESEILNVSSCTLNKDKDVSSSAAQPSTGSFENEQNKTEKMQKAVTERSPVKKSTDKVQNVEAEKKCDNTDNEHQKESEINSETNEENLFQDISADEWRKGRRGNTDPEVNSVHSLSTERLDNESEAECDLILVDRDAWLAAENMKAEKENEMFDYDSDDTVVLKSRLDSSKAQQQKMELSMVKEENNEHMMDDDLSNSKNNDNTVRRSTETASGENEGTDVAIEEVATETKNANENTDAGANISNTEQLEEVIEMNSSVSKIKEKKRLSKSEKIDKGEEKVDSKLDKSTAEKSFTRKSKSLRESTGDANNIKHLSTSGEKENSDEDKTSKKVAMKSPNSTARLNESVTRKNSSTKSVLTPGNKNNEKRTLSNSSDKKKVVLKQLDADSSESESASEIGSSMSKKLSTILIQKGGNKNRSPNYSMYVHVGSGSDVANDNVDSDTDNSEIGGRKIPKFLFNDTSSDESDSDGKDSINSDIKREYNLDGKDSPKFSDDDVPGDECRASESEYSDPDDNGSDLADFVVDDDEVEEDDDDDETEEKGDNNDDEESELGGEECGEEVAEEHENDESDEDKNNEDIEVEDECVTRKMKVIEEESEAEEEGDKESEKADEEAKITEEQDEANADTAEAATEQEQCIKNNIAEHAEEQENMEEDETKESNNEITISEIRNSFKEEKSKMNISADLISPEKRHKKKKRKSNENSINDSKEDNLDTSCLSSTKRKQAQKQYSNETTEKVSDSPVIFTKKINKFNRLSDCSTPKSSISKHEALEISMHTPNLTIEGATKRMSSSSCKKSSGLDRSQKLSNTSKELNKSNDLQHSSLCKSLLIDLTEPAEKTNLRRSMSSNVMQLNKSMLTPNSNTPTAKFLKRDKLNESLPALKFDCSSKKLSRLNLAKETYNAPLLANTEVAQESEEHAKEQKVSSLSPPEDDVLCTVDESRPAVKKQKKQKCGKKTNTENVEIINAEEQVTISAAKPKNRKRAYLVCAPEMDNLEQSDGVLEMKEKKKKRKKQKVGAEPKEPELLEDMLCDDAYADKIENSTNTSQKTKRKEKRKLKTVDVPEVVGVESSAKVTKKLKVINDDVAKIRSEKPLKKKHNLQNQISPKTGSTKIPKTIEEPAKEKSGKNKGSILIAAVKTKDEVPRGMEDVVDTKVSKRIKTKRSKELLKIVENRTDGKRPKLESKTIPKMEMKTVTRNTDQSLNKALLKQRKVAKKKKQLLPSRSGYVAASNILVEDDYSTPSLCQGVTHFEVVDLKTVMKPKKNSNAVATFKQRMLARNNRQPTSAYLMYLKKQKASGKRTNFDTSF